MKNYKEIFGNIDTSPYTEAAKKFLPDKIKVLFIFESPPYPPPIHPITKKINPDWSYFYRYETKGSNALRREVCDTVFNEKIVDHKEFLTKFCNTGYFLIDAVDYPINKIIEENKDQVKLKNKVEVDNKEREKIIYSEAEELIETIKYWIKKSESDLSQVKMLLVKVSVYNGLIVFDNIFKKQIDERKYKILNEDTIPFPMVPNNTKFKADVRKYLNIYF